MAKEGEDIIQGATKEWNISDGFTKFDVLKILVDINMYEVMAKFGKQNLEEIVPYEEIPHKRVEGFDRMIFALRQIISNCMFQIDRDDLDKVNRLVGRIDTVESRAGAIATEFTNGVTHERELKINEEHFRKSLDVLSDVKQDLHSILNKAGLIFRRGEETNLDEFMKSIYEG